MKNCIFLIGILFTGLRIFSQTCPAIAYTYDLNGERLQQSLVVKPCGETSRTKKADSTTTNPLNIKVYPNPAQNMLTVDLGQPVSPVESMVYLYDLQGRIINTQKTTLNMIQIDVSQLNAGEYYLNVIQGKKHAGYTVMKSN